jgi:hypothetical protein
LGPAFAAGVTRAELPDRVNVGAVTRAGTGTRGENDRARSSAKKHCSSVRQDQAFALFIMCHGAGEAELRPVSFERLAFRAIAAKHDAAWRPTTRDNNDAGLSAA